MNNAIELYQNNIKLTTYVANKWLSSTPQLYHDEILSEARIGLWKACKTFEQSKGFAFSTYAVRVISNEIGHFMRKQHRHMNNVSIDVSLSDTEKISLIDSLGYEPNIESNINYQTLIIKLNKYPTLKRLAAGESQTRIAKSIGKSQAQVSRYIIRERKLLASEI